MNLSYNTESEIEGTIKVYHAPRGLGILTDIDGKRWDIRGIIGRYVQAVPENELHPYYTDTSGCTNFGLVSQTWKPYLIEVVKKEVEETS